MFETIARQNEEIKERKKGLEYLAKLVKEAREQASKFLSDLTTEQTERQELNQKYLQNVNSLELLRKKNKDSREKIKEKEAEIIKNEQDIKVKETELEQLKTEGKADKETITNKEKEIESLKGQKLNDVEIEIMGT